MVPMQIVITMCLSSKKQLRLSRNLQIYLRLFDLIFEQTPHLQSKDFDRIAIMYFIFDERYT